MRNRTNTKESAPKVMVPDNGGRTQIGGRVSGGMNTRLKVSAALTEFSKDQILEDALAIYYGTADNEVFERQKEVLSLIRNLKEGKLPFELPLTPNKNNAALTSRGDSPKLTFRFKRMGS